jgi:hypothetical protein
LYKIGYILLFSYILSGCSVFRPSLEQDVGIAGKWGNKTLIQILEEQNVTSNNFFIQKAKIEIISGGITENFLASIKFLKPDTFLISLRSMTGLEAARIFLTKDTILVNDRINRQLMYGRRGAAESKYGVSSEMLPVILGDYINRTEGRDIEAACKDGFAVLPSNILGAKFIYKVDCKGGKAISVLREGSIEKNSVIINFENFIRMNNIVYPSVIKVKYPEMELNMEIERMESPWIGDIDFIPGKNYEVIELL